MARKNKTNTAVGVNVIYNAVKMNQSLTSGAKKKQQRIKYISSMQFKIIFINTLDCNHKNLLIHFNVAVVHFSISCVHICRMIHIGSVNSAIKINNWDDSKTHKLIFILFVSLTPRVCASLCFDTQYRTCTMHMYHIRFIYLLYMNVIYKIFPFLPVGWKMLDMNNGQWLIVVNWTWIMCEPVFINWFMFSTLLPIIPS